MKAAEKLVDLIADKGVIAARNFASVAIAWAVSVRRLVGGSHRTQLLSPEAVSHRDVPDVATRPTSFTAVFAFDEETHAKIEEFEIAGEKATEYYSQ